MTIEDSLSASSIISRCTGIVEGSDYTLVFKLILYGFIKGDDKEPALWVRVRIDPSCFFIRALNLLFWSLNAD